MSEITEKIAALRDESLQCTNCKLSKTRTNVVFGEGNPETPLMVVGEGPGATEDATGRPFVGRAGKMLDEALAAAGMDRRHVFICNIVKCRACLVEGTKYINRPPETDEVTACTPWLKQQIEIIKPLVILCIGAPSAKFIIKKNFKMTSERGLFFPTEYAECAIAALHPAYILRKMSTTDDGGKSLLFADVEAARKKVVELRRLMESKNEADKVTTE